jgi:hypothetical protein
MARLKIMFGVVLVSACVSGISQGPPDVSYTVEAEANPLAQCLAASFRRDPRSASCSGEGIKFEEYDAVGQSMLACAEDVPTFHGDANYRWTVFVSKAEEGAIVEIWQHSTLPGVDPYSERISPFVERCVEQLRG